MTATYTTGLAVSPYFSNSFLGIVFDTLKENHWAEL
jgi:hypothetical protein